MAEDVNKRLDDSHEDDQLEKEHFLRIVNAFKFYRTHSLRRIQVAETSYNSLSKRHQDFIPNFLDNLRTIKSCVDHNSEIIKLIIRDAEHVFENRNREILEEPEQNVKQMPPTNFDMEKVKTTLKQFVRDWSEVGRKERMASYDPVIKEVNERFPRDMRDPASVTILVPGAGLGRLAFEFAKCGYSCQGNEWSLFMLFASNFVLNKCKDVNLFTIYPWVHQWTNNTFTDDQTEPVKFPDVDPSELPLESNFSMAAGDFLEVYKEADAFDCVATVFFIDTAHNVIAYIEKIYNILKPGGYWINLGPLLYHYADVENECSIELSYEELKKVICQVGFLLEKEESDVRATYTQNPHSMLQYEYHSVFFVCKKPS